MKYLTSILLILAVQTSFAFGGSTTVGVPNPAAANCIKLGGTLESFEASSGYTDYNCAIEQWQLFTEMNKRNLVKPHSYPGPVVAMPNPAAVNCIDVEGKLSERIHSNDSATYCIVEEWTLLKYINVIY